MWLWETFIAFVSAIAHGDRSWWPFVATLLLITVAAVLAAVAIR